MITNLPASSDFDRLANNCLVQAFNIVFDADKQIDDNYDRALREEIWKYSQEKLNTAVVLIHQGIESLMKSSICLTTPLLLIESKRTDWPVLPKQRDKEFNDFYTLSAESLLHTFFATTHKKINEQLVRHIEDVRKVRNQIVHGISNTELTSSYVIDKILSTYFFFNGKDAWWRAVTTSHLNHPLTGYYDLGTESAQFAERLDYVLSTIGKARMIKHFSINIKGRSYFCPKCLKDYERGAGVGYVHKWAFLFPNTTESHLTKCINCSEQHNVIRQPCPYNECKGNVLFMADDEETGYCLTCTQDVYWNLKEEMSKNKEDNSNKEEQE